MIVEKLTELFVATFQDSPQSITALEAHASQRKLYRIKAARHTVIGVLYSNHQENTTFIALSKFFRQKRLPVPEIYAENLKSGAYLMEDLGETTLFDVLKASRKPDEAFPKTVERLYCDALDYLTQFQVSAAKGLDYGMCFSKPFDTESMVWDMHYFRDSFIKLLGIAYREDALEKDFQKLATFLGRADASNFMYRDFQSRNIMVNAGKLYFIDYQSGRKGAQQYDVASLLYQARAEVPPQARLRLLQGYMHNLKKVCNVQSAEFLRYYPGFVLLRMLQVFGTYGSLGLTKGKSAFAQSIPLALKNLEHFLQTEDVSLELPELYSVLHTLLNDKALRGQ